MTDNQREIREEFVSGFCKQQNQTRTVLCELERRRDGSRALVSADCSYGHCEHSRNCLLMAQIL